MHPQFQPSADTATLAHLLSEIEVGDTITYEALSRAIGRDVRGEARGALYSARHTVMREDKMIFDVVRGEGLQRLDDPQIVSLSDRCRDRIRRTARRTAASLTCVNYDSMPREAQTKHNVALSMLGVIAALSTERATKRLEHHIDPSGITLPAAKAAIAALGGDTGAATTS